jgi:hypothetical protein
VGVESKSEGAPWQCEEVGMSLRVHHWSLTALAKSFHLNWRMVGREV